jgi:hypothetical protein
MYYLYEPFIFFSISFRIAIFVCKRICSFINNFFFQNTNKKVFVVNNQKIILKNRFILFIYIFYIYFLSWKFEIFLKITFFKSVEQSLYSFCLTERESIFRLSFKNLTHNCFIVFVLKKRVNSSRNLSYLKPFSNQTLNENSG